MSAPPPTRQATFMSRAKMARRNEIGGFTSPRSRGEVGCEAIRVRARPASLSAGESPSPRCARRPLPACGRGSGLAGVAHLQGFCAVQPEWAVRGGDDEPPAARCGASCRRGSPARRVERGGRFVEQPDRAPDGEETRERQPAALAGREIRGRQARARRSSRTAAKASSADASAAQKLIPELRFSADAQRGLERIEVAQIMRLLGEDSFRAAALELHEPRRAAAAVRQ